MFITFEGVDGSGKSTHLELLKKELADAGHDVVSLREPGGTAFSETIRELLLTADYGLGPNTELLLFQAARSYLTEKVILPALKAGRIVLCDRYFDSTTAYQGYGRGIDMKVIHTSNQIGSLGVIPDVTFFFDISLEISKKRSGNRGPKDNIESSGDEFYGKVIEGYRALARSEERIIRIDASSDMETVSREIKKLTLNFITNGKGQI